MSVEKLEAKDKILLILITLSWIIFFVYLGNVVVKINYLSEVVGFFCGLSVSFLNIYIYSKIKENK